MSQNNWSTEEKLQRLDIAAPLDWNDYNDYLLNGGKLEYEDWQAQVKGREKIVDVKLTVRQAVELKNFLANRILQASPKLSAAVKRELAQADYNNSNLDFAQNALHIALQSLLPREE